MDNRQAAGHLALLADLIDLVEAQPFKSRAFHNAARTLKGLPEPFTDLMSRGTLADIPGFGRGVVGKLEELAKTGGLTELDELRSRIPPGVLVMRRISGLGAKKLRALYLEHGIETLDALEQAARDGSLARLPGFGARSAERIVDGISQVRSFYGKLRLPEARRLAAEVQHVLEEIHTGCTVRIAGEVRRHMEVVARFEWIVAGDPEPAAAKRLERDLPDCETVQTVGRIWQLGFQEGLSGTVRFVSPARFGWACLEATGPAEYVEHVAAANGPRDGDEWAILRDAGQPELPPECRDLPELWQAGVPGDLLGFSHLRGVLHCHTDYSDGLATLRDMAEAARARGLDYIGICDHSQSAAYAGGLRPDRVRAQQDEIDRLNDEYGGSFRIFKGIESDILADGTLDYDDAMLATFDFVVASIHSGLDMDIDEATERICTALAQPYTTILGHATGRLLLSRRGYPLDWDRVIDTAQVHGVVIELNAHPQRLDIDWRLLPRLFAAGLRTSVNPDAHAPDGIDDMHYGVDVARKAGATPDRVLNTLETEAIARFFAQRRR